MRKILVTALVLALVPAARASAQDAVPLYDNLGSHSYAITTDAPDAQAYFTQGLRLYYAFNHEEAVRAFEEATRLDPACAMCWWGIGVSLGPNINLPQDSISAVRARAATDEAVKRASNAGKRERAFIEALDRRYAPVPPADRSRLDRAYAEAMGTVADRWPGDAEAATLHAESLMDLSPWNYWTEDGSPGPNTGVLLGRLEDVLRENPDHPGANHLYIHAVEAVDPERAVAEAERLAGLMPGAGHIVHMPGHIYVRVGRYRDAIRANEHAVHADETWIRDQKPAQGVYVGGYYPHNYDFLAFAASMIGRQEQSVTSSEKLQALAPVELIHVPGMTFLQAHRTRHLQFKVRFGLWDRILEVPEPDAALLHERAIWHYARGRAYDALGRADEAARESGSLETIATDPAVAELRLEFNASASILGIASEVLKAHVAHSAGDFDGAAAHLDEAVRLEDALTYGEPPEWSVPVRQEAGHLYLEAGDALRALEAFRADLERFPENAWSLYGLAKALELSGDRMKADDVAVRYAGIWEGAGSPW